MDCVLRTEDGRRAALYSAGGRLLFVWLPPFGRYGRGFDRRMEAGAAVLAEDCLSGPAACMRGDRICCAYVQRTGELVCGAFPAGALRPGMSRQSQLFPYQTCPPPEMSGADSARAGRILHPFLFPAGEGAGLLFSGGDRGRRDAALDWWLGFPFAAGADRCKVVAGGDGSLDFEAAGLETGDGAGRDGSGPKDKALCLGRGEVLRPGGSRGGGREGPPAAGGAACPGPPAAGGAARAGPPAVRGAARSGPPAAGGAACPGRTAVRGIGPGDPSAPGGGAEVAGDAF